MQDVENMFCSYFVNNLLRYYKCGGDVYMITVNIEFLIELIVWSYAIYKFVVDIFDYLWR